MCQRTPFVSIRADPRHPRLNIFLQMQEKRHSARHSGCRALAESWPSPSPQQWVREKAVYCRIFFVSPTRISIDFLSSLPLANDWLTLTSLSTHIITVTSASFESL